MQHSLLDHVRMCLRIKVFIYSGLPRVSLVFWVSSRIHFQRFACISKPDYPGTSPGFLIVVCTKSQGHHLILNIFFSFESTYNHSYLKEVVNYWLKKCLHPYQCPICLWKQSVKKRKQENAEKPRLPEREFKRAW